MVAYNLIFDAFILPLNFILIFKELSMEFFQFLHKNAGTGNDDVSIGLIDITDTFITIAFFLNPFNLLTFIWKFVTGRVM
jgi:hypothetical protein